MEASWNLRGEERFQQFIADNATCDYKTALEDLKTQFLADEETNKFFLAAEKSKSGEAIEKKYLGVCMSYDAQGNQVGGGKAYLDRGKEIVKKDITLVFM